MKKYISFFLLTVISVALYSQDTIRVMHYNMMYYGQNSSYCTSSNNPLAAKDINLKKITKYVKPDILTANELAPNNNTHQHILDQILNTNGVTHYKKGAMSNVSGSDLSNGMFYNSNKLVLLSQKNFYTSVRDINIYNFYYKAYNLTSTHDTAHLICIIVHLKAGNTVADSIERIAQSNIIMNYLNTLNKKANYLLMGDFNTRTNDEKCFQNFVNYSNADFRFYDPVNQMGDWNSNYLYCNVHTQSTHSSSTGCFSTGGMDDRFDFILESEYIKNGTDHFQYVNGSYKAIGQDGNHLNDAINDGTNNSAPDSIIDALYAMSDHLPVVMNLRVNQTVMSINEVQAGRMDVNFPNPVADKLCVSLRLDAPSQLKISIINLLGQVIYSDIRDSYGVFANYEIPVSSLNQGLYFLNISDGKNKPVTKTFVKQ